MKALKFFFLLLFLALITDYVSADEAKLNAHQILTKMRHAMTVLNYQGTVIFSKEGSLEPMKYFHVSQNGVEQEYLSSLNSPLREIIRNKNDVIFLFKETQQVVVKNRNFEQSFLIDMPENIQELDSMYHFDNPVEEIVAAKPSYAITIQPKDEFRPARKLWIDKESFVPLMLAVYDLSGKTLQKVMFTDMEIKDLIPFKDLADLPVKATEQANLPLTHASFITGKLPLGFREIFFAIAPLHDDSKQPVEHLLLSDGLASVSVYVENKNPATGDNVPDGLQSIGATNSYTRTINNSVITVMGEVPEQTVKMISENIKLRK
jgi:sigma-E factor negative regulatory protein RseB